MDARASAHQPPVPPPQWSVPAGSVPSPPPSFMRSSGASVGYQESSAEVGGSRGRLIQVAKWAVAAYVTVCTAQAFVAANLGDWLPLRAQGEVDDTALLFHALIRSEWYFYAGAALCLGAHVVVFWKVRGVDGRGDPRLRAVLWATSVLGFGFVLPGLLAVAFIVLVFVLAIVIFAAVVGIPLAILGAIVDWMDDVDGWALMKAVGKIPVQGNNYTGRSF